MEFLSLWFTILHQDMECQNQFIIQIQDMEPQYITQPLGMEYLSQFTTLNLDMEFQSQFTIHCILSLDMACQNQHIIQDQDMAHLSQVRPPQ
jgi:hypothetical protein